MVDVDREEVEQVAVLVLRAATGDPLRADAAQMDRVVGDLHELEVRAGIERVL